MSKQGSWFFDGYESESVPGPNGRLRRTLVYRGAWYGLSLSGGAARRHKLRCVSLLLAATILFLLICFFPSAGGMTPWVGATCLFGLVPLMFLWIGAVNYLTAGSEWELRVFYAGYRRLFRWNVAFLAVMGLTLTAEAVYLVLHPAQAVGELPYLFGVAACTACSGGLFLLQRRHPAQVVRGPEVC